VNGIEVDVTESTYRTPLMLASLAGSLLTVQTLLQAGAQVNKADVRGWVRGWTPLAFASSIGSMAVVKELLKHNADPEHRFEDGRRCINLASTDELRVHLLTVTKLGPNEIGADGRPIEFAKKKFSRKYSVRPLKFNSASSASSLSLSLPLPLHLPRVPWQLGQWRLTMRVGPKWSTWRQHSDDGRDERDGQRRHNADNDAHSDARTRKHVQGSVLAARSGAPVWRRGVVQSHPACLVLLDKQPLQGRKSHRAM